MWAEEAHRAQCAMALLQDEKASLQIQITCLNESEASLRKELHNLRVHHDVNDNNLMKQNENLNFRITEVTNREPSFSPLRLITQFVSFSCKKR